MNRQYPCLEISRSRLRHNMEEGHLPLHRPGHPGVRRHQGVQRLPEVGRLFGTAGPPNWPAAAWSRSSAAAGPGCRGRICCCGSPMESELEDVARWCDYSLESEAATLDAWRRPAPGRELSTRPWSWRTWGICGRLLGPGRDAGRVRPCGAGPAPCGAGRRRREPGCYGSIQPTPENLGQLVHIARRVEDTIGRKLEIVSGGAPAPSPWSTGAPCRRASTTCASARVS